MEYIQLIAGLILLLVSANYLVKGGVSLAEKFKISPLVIGMTVIAFGTSAPEFIVSLSAAIKGNPEIAIGNVVGSNIANIGLILAITALILPIPVQKESIRNDGPLMLIASILFILASMNGMISRVEGLIGFGILLAYTVWMIRASRKSHKERASVAIHPPRISPLMASLFIIGSSIGLAYGANFLIEGATVIATKLGVSQKVIGVTIVSFGTSVPELAASVTAALKKETDISIGNIIGSNIFNILCVIGLSSAIHPIPVDFALFRPDFIWMLAFSVLILVFIYPLRANFRAYIQPSGKLSAFSSLNGSVLGRLSAFILLVLYIFYIYLLF